MAVSTDFLSDEEVAAFQRDGFLVLKDFASQSFLERMREATRDALERLTPPLEFEADLNYPGAPESRDAHGGGTVRRLRAAHSRGIVFTEWVSQPPLLHRLRQLLGGPIVMPLAHHNCIMTKHPRFSSDTGWHQDIRYWSFARPDLINAWLALGPEHRENGCLRVIPGSHTATLSPARFDEQVFLHTELEENSELLDAAIDVELDAGDLLLFHAKTLHAATRNQGDQTKYSVVFTFRPLDNHPQAGSRSAAMPELLLG